MNIFFPIDTPHNNSVNRFGGLWKMKCASNLSGRCLGYSGYAWRFIEDIGCEAVERHDVIEPFKALSGLRR